MKSLPDICPADFFVDSGFLASSLNIQLTCPVVADYRTNERTRTVAAGLSSASEESVQKNRRFGRLVENRSQTCLSRYFSNNIPKLHSNYAHSTSADNTATPPPTDRVPLSNEKRAVETALLKCG